MEWDLSTIEHHDSCPWGENCHIVTGELTNTLGDGDSSLCVWCFVLAQAEWVKEMFNTLSENMADEVAIMKTNRKGVDIDRKRQPQTRWDAYGF